MRFRQFDITIQDLQVFLAVAQCSSFSGAARLVGKSQPSVSSRIKQLEQRLQTKLIIRDAKSVRLSDEGKKLRADAFKLVDGMSALHDKFNAEADRQKSVVRLCSPIMIGSAIIGPTIEQFHKRHPGTTVSLVDDIPESCIQRVADGTSEIAIVSDTSFPAEVQFRPVYRDVCQVVSSSGHPLTRNKTASIAEILKYPILSPDINMSLRHQLEKEAEERDIEISFVEEAFGVTNYISLLSMAASNMGVAIASTGLIPDSLRGIMSLTDISDCKFVRTFGLVTARNSRLSPSAELFCEHLAEVGAQLEIAQSQS